MSKFQQTALSIPKEYRCVQTSSGSWNLPLNDCFFGVPQSSFFGWTVMNSIPKDLKGINFYLGGEYEELIADFVVSEYPKVLERLAIGNSSYSVGKHQDYRALIKNLMNTEFPNLKFLELGVWELFCNSHCLYGKLGDVTSLLKNCPQLVILGLYGYFELNESVKFGTLKDITVTLEDCTTLSNGGYISQLTLSNLLKSDFPCLQEAFINLSCQENENGYKLPEEFLDGKNMPKLNKLEITGGFSEGEKERLLESSICKRPDITLFLDDMLVS